MAGSLRPARLAVALVGAVVVAAASLAAIGGAAASPRSPRTVAAAPNFGPNVLVFDPSMPTSQIQAAVDAIAAQQVDNEMGTQRYALLFKPGTYGSAAHPLHLPGRLLHRGRRPGRVADRRHHQRPRRRLQPVPGSGQLHRARQLLALAVEPDDQRRRARPDCRSSARLLGGLAGGADAAGQHHRRQPDARWTTAPPGRSTPAAASSPTRRRGFVINGSQQQFLVRDSSIGGWSNGVWNQVFSGVVGAPPQSFSPNPCNPPPYTTLPTSPVTRERPFLYVDASGNYSVFVPALRRDSSGTTWADGPAAGSSIPIARFYVATRPTDVRQTINKALAQGQNLLFTPGIYHLDRTLKVRRADTVVLGLGFATLVPDRRDPAHVGRRRAGREARRPASSTPGTVNSPSARGRARRDAHKQRPERPDRRSQDVFFRIGGRPRARRRPASSSTATT